MEMNFYLIVRLILIKSEIGSEVNDRPKRNSLNDATMERNHALGVRLR